MTHEATHRATRTAGIRVRTTDAASGGVQSAEVTVEAGVSAGTLALDLARFVADLALVTPDGGPVTLLFARPESPDG